MELVIAETEEREEEHYQLPFVENVPTNCWTEEEEVKRGREMKETV